MTTTMESFIRDLEIGFRINEPSVLLRWNSTREELIRETKPTVQEKKKPAKWPASREHKSPRWSVIWEPARIEVMPSVRSISWTHLEIGHEPFRLNALDLSFHSHSELTEQLNRILGEPSTGRSLISERGDENREVTFPVWHLSRRNPSINVEVIFSGLPSKFSVVYQANRTDAFRPTLPWKAQ
jgi:hypothetical protein